MSRQNTKVVVVAVALWKPGLPGWRQGEPEKFVVVTKRMRGEWHLHGGVVHYGESRRCAACRKTREELGIGLHVQQLVHIGKYVTESMELTLFAAQAHDYMAEPRLMEPDKALAHTWVSMEKLHVLQPALDSLAWCQVALLLFFMEGGGAAPAGDKNDDDVLLPPPAMEPQAGTDAGGSHDEYSQPSWSDDPSDDPIEDDDDCDANGEVQAVGVAVETNRAV